MQFGKILFASAIGVGVFASTSAMADRDFTPNPHVSNANTKIYIELHSGYARQNYFSNMNWRTVSQIPGEGTNFSNNENVEGGYSGGADIGYEINKHYAVEFGWFYLPSVNVMQQGTAPAYLTSWAMYLAAKYMMPIYWMNNTTAFFKLGAEYRKAELEGGALAAAGGYDTSTSESDFIRPMFATGVDYHFDHAWTGIMQYAFFMGARNSFPLLTANTGALGTVAANVFTLGLGYQFTV